MIGCCIFDLDGVIVDTARFHYLAWARLARELGFTFTPEQGEATKGLSRMQSLDLVLRAGGVADRFATAEKERLAARKNAFYLEYITRLTPSDLLPGVASFLTSLRPAGLKAVLGSSSKNACTVLDRLGISPLFDAVVDGTMVAHAKPDPEVFLQGAQAVDAAPAACVVFEDAAAGIEAASRAGMRSVGVGCGPAVAAATLRITSFEGFTIAALFRGMEACPKTRGCN